jgi:outer membrane receptor protein involved in Fe transport
VPDTTASLRADYRDPSGWFGGVGVTADGRTYYTESEDLFYAQRAYALLGAHLGYGTGRWRLSLYGNNLTNVGYYSAITPGVNSGTPGAPRTYGVEVSVKF